MKNTICCLAFCFLMTSVAAAQTAGNLITANSAGKVKLGMTVAQVRKAVAPMKIERTSDGEGIALIAVKKGQTVVMTLYAGEENRESKLNEKAVIEHISVLDRSYRTAAGVRPGMLLATAEKLYGKVKEIMMSEIESREFVQFTDHPMGLDFRLHGKDSNAGVYPPQSSTTTSYTSGAYVFSIDVTGRSRSITGDSSAADFSSEYTELKAGCRSVGGEEGGHVSNFCKGPGNYQIHYFDAATIYQINVGTDDRKWEEPVMTIDLDKLETMQKIEWRLANGRPFAVLVAQPGTDKVIVRGLDGFERIKFEESGKGAVERARSIADNDYKESSVPSIRISITDRSPSVSVNARLPRVSDKVKYVVNAGAGDRMSVKIDAKKWTGDEGPIMVGIVTAPDGSGDGGPGGTVFDSVLTQTGDYGILVYQNAAKSQTQNVEITVTVTIGGSTTQTMDEIAARFLPEGSRLMHPVLRETIGGSAKSIVVLYGKEGPAMSYSGMVLTPAESGYKKFDLPLPEFTWSIEEPKAVFFANADGDRELELFIIGECMTGIGPTGAQPFYRTRVYDRQGSGFVHMEMVSDEVGRLGTAPAIRRQLAAIIKRAEARFQPMDIEALNARLAARSDAKTPLYALELLLDPFGDMLSRTVSMKTESMESWDSLEVEVTDDGYADDSVRGERFRFKLIKNSDGDWRVSTAWKGWRCQPGRGSQTFASRPCL